eukprot:CAMPEP_0113279986 /NCGR_PEP_ID=MMETSP0008_2-20120614/27488_1 /TAXON_ID=97485 /ORGANISM="Prymnesium parvum" /LENGTH=261 /DNA_ID=CAMNT_0000130229 /DNA_START=72 /DNA_END=855 /DNA_ORIENTATION=- /assembly_acc=CAM_ASM_000153
MKGKVDGARHINKPSADKGVIHAQGQPMLLGSTIPGSIRCSVGKESSTEPSTSLLLSGSGLLPRQSNSRATEAAARPATLRVGALSRYSPYLEEDRVRHPSLNAKLHERRFQHCLEVILKMHVTLEVVEAAEDARHNPWRADVERIRVASGVIAARGEDDAPPLLGRRLLHMRHRDVEREEQVGAHDHRHVEGRRMLLQELPDAQLGVHLPHRIPTHLRGERVVLEPAAPHRALGVEEGVDLRLLRRLEHMRRDHTDVFPP